MDGQIRKTESTKSQSFTARLSASKDFFPLSIELVEEKLKKDVVHFNKFWLLNKTDTFFPLLVETQNSVINYNYGSKSVGFSISTFP